MTRDVVFLVYPGFQLLDLSGPLSAFQIAGDIAEGAYRIHVHSPGGGTIVSSSGLGVMTSPAEGEPSDTCIVVGAGVPEIALGRSAGLHAAVEAGVSSAKRVASVCTGAFILAALGRLDGRHATTHWKHAAVLQRMFPKVIVDADKIYVQDGKVWTSAGISAGIDLALAMIEEDLGPEVARATARTLVVYHRRPGGQSQFSALLEMEPDSDRIRKVLTFMSENLDQRLSTERLAEVAHLSPRQFGRAFLLQTGETPAKAVERLRVEVARPRIERGLEPIESIARSVGFSDPERMRRAFLRILGHPPQGIRRMAMSSSGRRVNGGPLVVHA